MFCYSCKFTLPPSIGTPYLFGSGCCTCKTKQITENFPPIEPAKLLLYLQDRPHKDHKIPNLYAQRNRVEKSDKSIFTEGQRDMVHCWRGMSPSAGFQVPPCVYSYLCLCVSGKLQWKLLFCAASLMNNMGGCHACSFNVELKIFQLFWWVIR